MEAENIENMSMEDILVDVKLRESRVKKFAGKGLKNFDSESVHNYYFYSSQWNPIWIQNKEFFEKKISDVFTKNKKLTVEQKSDILAQSRCLTKKLEDLSLSKFESIYAQDRRYIDYREPLDLR